MNGESGRVEGWEQRLYDVIEHHRGMVFDYPTTNCFFFAMDVVVALIGWDPYADERGKFTNSIGAALRLKAWGFNNLAQAMDAVFVRIGPAMAWRGDIAYIEDSGNPEGPLLAVFINNGIIAHTEHGMKLVDRALASQAWRVE